MIVCCDERQAQQIESVLFQGIEYTMLESYLDFLDARTKASKPSKPSGKPSNPSNKNSKGAKGESGISSGETNFDPYHNPLTFERVFDGKERSRVITRMEKCRKINVLAQESYEENVPALNMNAPATISDSLFQSSSPSSSSSSQPTPIWSAEDLIQITLLPDLEFQT